MSTEEEEPRQRGEDCKRDNLHDDAGDCNVAPEIQLTLVATGAGGQAPPHGLQSERNAIAADEEPGVVFRLEMAVLGAEGDDDVLQGQVDAHCEPGGAHDQTANLRREAIVGEGIAVEHEAAEVADCFDETAAAEGEGVRPRSVSDAEVELGDEEDDEEGEEEGVGGEGGEVAVHGVLDEADGGDGFTGVYVGVRGHDGLRERGSCRRCGSGRKMIAQERQLWLYCGCLRL